MIAGVGAGLLALLLMLPHLAAQPQAGAGTFGHWAQVVNALSALTGLVAPLLLLAGPAAGLAFALPWVAIAVTLINLAGWALEAAGMLQQCACVAPPDWVPVSRAQQRLAITVTAAAVMLAPISPESTFDAISPPASCLLGLVAVLLWRRRRASVVNLPSIPALRLTDPISTRTNGEAFDVSALHGPTPFAVVVGLSDQCGHCVEQRDAIRDLVQGQSGSVTVQVLMDAEGEAAPDGWMTGSGPDLVKQQMGLTGYPYSFIVDCSSGRLLSPISYGTQDLWKTFLAANLIKRRIARSQAEVPAVS